MEEINKQHINKHILISTHKFTGTFWNPFHQHAWISVTVQMQDITSFAQPIWKNTAALFVWNSIRNASITKLSGRNLQRCGGVGEKIYGFSPTFLQTVANYQTGSEDEQTLSHRCVGNGVSIRSTETLVFTLCFLCRGSSFPKCAEPQLCTVLSQLSLSLSVHIHFHTIN